MPLQHKRQKMTDKTIIDSKRSTLVSLSDDQRQLWVNAMKPVWKRFEKQVGKDNLQAAIAAN